MKGVIVAVEKVGEQYECSICGNKVNLTEVGGGTLVCCGEDMEQIENKALKVINSTDSGG